MYIYIYIYVSTKTKQRMNGRAQTESKMHSRIMSCSALDNIFTRKQTGSGERNSKYIVGLQ